jgi:hypothetical protein
MLILAVPIPGLPSGAHAEPASPRASAERQTAVDPAEAGRVYLSQSLAALQWARRYADAAARSGGLAGFDLDRYLAELDTIAHGLERYLRPEGPPGASLTPVEITGQFLLDGLRGSTPHPAGDPHP